MKKYLLSIFSLLLFFPHIVFAVSFDPEDKIIAGIILWTAVFGPFVFASFSLGGYLFFSKKRKKWGMFVWALGLPGLIYMLYGIVKSIIFAYS